MFAIEFEYRSDNGPRMVGPFAQRQGAEGHLSDIVRSGFSFEAQVIPLARVIDSIRSAKGLTGEATT